MESLDKKSRRSHTKSRFGCRCCKLRKVKCDEQRPQCGNCLRINKPCDFQQNSLSSASILTNTSKVPIPRNSQTKTTAIAIQTRQQPTRKAPENNNPLPTPSPSPAYDLQVPLYPGQETSAQPLEQRLFRTYIAKLNSTLWPDDDRQAFAPNPRLVARFVPQLATQSPPYLMHAVLAITALNLRIAAQPLPLPSPSCFSSSSSSSSHSYSSFASAAAASASYSSPSSESDRRALEIASTRYLASAVSRFRDVLRGGFETGCADAVYLTAMTIAGHVLSQHLLAAEGGGGDLDAPLEWVRAFRGLRVLVKLSSSAAAVGSGPAETEVSALMPPGEWPVPHTVDLDLSAVETGGFEFLMGGLGDGVSACERDAYRDVVAYFNLLYRSPGRALMWWFVLDNRPAFLDLVSRGDQKARVLLGVYLCYVGRFNHSRPMGWIAKRDVQTVRRGLDEENSLMLDRAIDIIREKFEPMG